MLDGGAEIKPAPANRLQAYTVEQAAGAIAWHPESLRLACRKGRIQGAVRMGKCWRIPEAVLARLIETGIPSAPAGGAA